MENYAAIDSEYLELFCGHLYKTMGIFIEESQKPVLSQKLSKMMHDAGITDSSQFYHMILSPPISQAQIDLQKHFTDIVTVHKTNFFRENNHFEFLKENIKDICDKSQSVYNTGQLRIWSAACSTGEEPYTLSMLMKEILPHGVTAKILATDISPDSLKKAMQGTYIFGPEDYIPLEYSVKYFTSLGNKKIIKDEVKNQVTFRLFNLMEPFPFKHPFDIIFCRNVMIYFDKIVQENLVNKFYNAMDKGGFLFIGHSESLIQLKHNFAYHAPTIYRK